ncbi:MAG: phosphatidylglycerophosphatase and protein-tyrosine phosphatase 1 family protein [Aureliella sp.]
MQRWQARAIYYPTLGYNYVLGRLLKVRNWWDEVNDHLVLGAVPLHRDPELFAAMGVTAVVNMCEEYAGPAAHYERLGIEQLWLPTVDFNHPSKADVQLGAAFIEQHASSGGKTYVHCKAGRARSATVALWWLVRYRGMTAEEAQATLLAARPHTNPQILARPVIVQLCRELESA